MAPEIVGIIWSVVVPAIITAVVSVWLGRAQSRSVKVDIENKYREMLGAEIDERKKLMEEVESIKEENRKLRHAFTRAIAFIRVNLPNAEIPDFFVDTGDLKKN